MSTAPASDKRLWVVILCGVALFGGLIECARSAPWLAILLIAVPLMATIAVVVPRFVPQTPRMVRLVGKRLAIRPWASLFWCVALGAAGLFGHSWHEEDVDLCGAGLQRFSSSNALNTNSAREKMRQLESLAAEIDKARIDCDSAGMTAESELMVRERGRLKSRSSDLKESAAVEEKAAAEQAVVDREANAVARFPAVALEIKSSLATANSQAAHQSWTECDETLTGIQATIDGFDGTSIEKTTQLAGLQKQVIARQTQIKPQLEIIKSRASPPKFVGGCCLQCLSYAKQVANDPDSIECVQSSIPEFESPNWTTTMLFRGKNAFGGKILTHKKFYLQNNQVVEMR